MLPFLPLSPPQPALFRSGHFILASGATSPWKIECEALTEADWTGLAVMMMEALIPGPFGQVEGVPHGGIPLANALQPYADDQSRTLLVVDDVWTTGKSMERYIDGIPTDLRVARAVAFARRPPPPNIMALFTMPYPYPYGTTPAPIDCCGNDAWRGRLCPYHQGWEDGVHAALDRI